MSQNTQNITQSPQGTNVNGTFYPMTGTVSSAIPTPATPPVPPIVQSSRPAKIEGVGNMVALQDALKQYGLGADSSSNNDKEISVDTYSDPYTKLLDTTAKRSSDASKAMVATIKARRYQNKAGLDATYDNYKQGLQLLGIQHNQAQFTPDLLAGHITAIEAEHQAKIQQLDAEEAKALMDAEMARSENDLRTLKEKMDYVKEIKKEKIQSLKDVYDKMSTETKIADIQAEQIYNQVQALGEGDKEAFIQAVAQKYNIPVPALVKSLADVKTSKAKGTGSGKNYSAANIPDDILTDLTDDIQNTEGLTLNDLISAYPEVSTSYLSTLYKTLGKGTSTDLGDIEEMFSDEEFKQGAINEKGYNRMGGSVAKYKEYIKNTLIPMYQKQGLTKAQIVKKLSDKFKAK